MDTAVDVEKGVKEPLYSGAPKKLPKVDINSFPEHTTNNNEIPLAPIASVEKGFSEEDEEDKHPVDDVPMGKIDRVVHRIRDVIFEFYTRHRDVFHQGCLVVFILLFLVYLGFAVRHSVKGAAFLLTVTGLVILSYVVKLFNRKLAKEASRLILKPIANCVNKRWKYIKWCICVALAGLLLTFLIYESRRDAQRLVSFAGLLVFVLFFYLTSTHPSKVRWRQVIWGLGLQIILGFTVLRWKPGYLAFKYLGEQVNHFLKYTDAGSKFAFGETAYLDHEFVFQSMPVILFFGAMTTALQYLGIIEAIVSRAAALMQMTMTTTAVESIMAALNIFLGYFSAILAVRPYIDMLTVSEYFAVLVAGFSSIGGSFIPIYIQFGVAPQHLLTAALMSAPAGLALAKLSYPETEISKTKYPKDVVIDRGNYSNVLDSIQAGAATGAKLAVTVVVNIITFMAVLAFVNAILAYLGGRVGYPQLDFKIICSYLFVPVAAMLGVDWEDIPEVASLLGTKVFLLEVMSYADLGKMLQNGLISDRSATIATYACCGFGSLCDLGIVIGTMAVMAPNRRRETSMIAIRAVLSGNAACWLTGCVAGMLYEPPVQSIQQSLNSTLLGNITNLENSTLSGIV